MSTTLHHDPQRPSPEAVSVFMWSKFSPGPAWQLLVSIARGGWTNSLWRKVADNRR